MPGKSTSSRPRVRQSVDQSIVGGLRTDRGLAEHLPGQQRRCRWMSIDGELWFIEVGYVTINSIDGQRWCISPLPRCLPSGLDRQRREAVYRAITMIWDDFCRPGESRQRRGGEDCGWTRDVRTNALWRLLASLLRPSPWIDYAALRRRRRRVQDTFTRIIRSVSISELDDGMLKAFQS